MKETFLEAERGVSQGGRFLPLLHFWWKEFRAMGRTALALRWALSVDGLLQDLRFGVRFLRRRPLFALVSIGTLGLGIGSATAMFSVVNGTLLRPLTYDRPEQVVHVWQTIPAWLSVESLASRWDEVTVDWPGFERWREGQSSFSAVALYGHQVGNLTGIGDPRQITTGYGTASLLPLLGLQPARGRWFSPGEEGVDAKSVAVISDAFWRTAFGEDPEILGRTVTVDDQSLEVIGVLPSSFGLRSVGSLGRGTGVEASIWVPAGALGQSMERGDFNFFALGRIRPDVDWDVAATEAGVHFMGDGQRGEFGARLQAREDAERGAARKPLLLLLGASFVLLLIACGNLVILLAGELTHRKHEIATRSAIGADRDRLARQFLTESGLIGLAGAGLGIGLAYLVTGTLLNLAPALPGGSDVAVDGKVLAFSVLTGLFTGLAFGLVPAARARAASRQAALRAMNSGGGKKDRRIQGIVLGGQMTGAVVLLSVCFLLGRSLENLLAVDPGFATTELSEVRVQFPFFRYSDVDERYQAILGIRDALSATPGVESVTGTNSLPFSGYRINTFPEVPGMNVTEGEPRPSARRRQVLPDYFRTLGLPILAGRGLADFDDSQAPGAVVVSESMAARYWPGRSPIGEMLIHSDTFVVVGVAGDVLHGALDEDAHPTFYLPLAQSYQRRPPLEISFVLRSSVPLLAMARQLHEAVWSVDPNLPVARIVEASESIQRSARAETFRTFLVGTFGVLATLLAGAGVFGVTSRRVARRRRELGIRMALGADRNFLVKDVVYTTSVPGTVGLMAGLFASLGTGWVLRAFLFEVDPWDPVSHLGALVLLGGVMVFAALYPARKGTALHPSEVLRQE